MVNAVLWIPLPTLPQLKLTHTEFSYSAKVTVSAGRTVTIKPGWK